MLLEWINDLDVVSSKYLKKETLTPLPQLTQWNRIVGLSSSNPTSIILFCLYMFVKSLKQI